MKIPIYLRSNCPVLLMACLGLMLSGRATAQTFTTLHSFDVPYGPSVTNSDGASPGGLILSSNTLYGTANAGGSSGAGTLFAINTDGTSFTNLHNFTVLSIPPSSGTNNDGAGPSGPLVLLGNTLYGTANAGGSSENGTVFAVNSDGTGFTNLHNFTATSGPLSTNSDGAFPTRGLVSSGNRMYGVADIGGSSGNGTVFALNTDGTGFRNLHSFTAAWSNNPSGFPVNSEGANPQARLILSGNTLYGTAARGGSWGRGAVFKVNTDGSGFTNLHNFAYDDLNPRDPSDGAYPEAGLILSGNTLYGTTAFGGNSDNGTVFAVNTDGSGFTNLHNFTAFTPSGDFGPWTNSDGAVPQAGLNLLGNTLYGTAVLGGSSDHGTLFAINTDGSGFTTMHSFTGLNDGANPYNALILSGNTLYGTASSGGSADGGTVFSLSFTPQLIITHSGANVILSWPTNVAGFDYTGYTLQSTPNLVSPSVWSTNSLEPVVIGGQNVITNPISGAQQFFRLISK